MFEPVESLKPDFVQRDPAALWSLISPAYQINEDHYVPSLVDLNVSDSQSLAHIRTQATDLVQGIRAKGQSVSMIDSLLLEYSLDTREGILLMCLAEALVRIPDTKTIDALIRDKLGTADWARHLKKSNSLLVNASSWGLLLTGKFVTLDDNEDGRPKAVIGGLVKRLGDPVVRRVMQRAMKIIGHQFVLGQTIHEALDNSTEYRKKGYTYSFDMLGEEALTADDAQHNYNAYCQAITAVGQKTRDEQEPAKPTLSIKLSALHPRYEVAQKQRILEELFTTLVKLAEQARQNKVGLTIDAEEADRLELSLELFQKLYQHASCRGWQQLGLVVQAYSKRAMPILCWLAALAHQQGDRIPIRLVKGAYWDTEIKLSQQQGLTDYPVYTRKESTDLSYLACARLLLADHIQPLLYPQFATHNAHTVASILHMAGATASFELQRLHGMGDALYDAILQKAPSLVRIYAPVGQHKELLPYLVRRLLENGANNSFVHQLTDPNYPIEKLVQHPAQTLAQYTTPANSQIAKPLNIFGDQRRNSAGININIHNEWSPLSQSIQAFTGAAWQGAPLLDGRSQPASDPVTVYAPYNHKHAVGTAYHATEAQVQEAFTLASKAQASWQAVPVSERAACLLKLADLLEDHRGEFMALCHQEAGKTIQDSIDEVREAVDFCRYYAHEATQNLSSERHWTNFSGTKISQTWQGKGIFVCISPWNFPLAIFIGQVVAALVTGNAVIAKPAEQTSLIATKAGQLILQAGIPGAVFSLLPGGAAIGAALTRHAEVNGVAFTGSTVTAQRINQSLADNSHTLATLIAETGGQNAMIVDSTALLEQVIADVIQSAFASAGQRCSALRVLYVQEDIADHAIRLLKGAMAELKVGNPCLLDVDVGPVIDDTAQQGLLQHIERMKHEGQLLAQTDNTDLDGYFVQPTAFEITAISQLEKEQFGPILHVIRFASTALDQVIDDINNTGFGLTLGIHSRNDQTAAHIDRRARVGNVYVNRNQIGASVGVQPFGGQGLSGTGPKAGGPHYLDRFVTAVTQ